MLHDVRRNRAWASMMVPRVTLLARLLFFRLWLLDVRCDTLRGRRLLLFPFFDARQSQAQVFLHLAHLSQRLALGFSQRLVFRSKVGEFFLVCQSLRVSERSRLNSYRLSWRDPVLCSGSSEGASNPLTGSFPRKPVTKGFMGPLHKRPHEKTYP